MSVGCGGERGDDFAVAGDLQGAVPAIVVGEPEKFGIVVAEPGAIKAVVEPGCGLVGEESSGAAVFRVRGVEVGGVLQSGDLADDDAFGRIDPGEAGDVVVARVAGDLELDGIAAGGGNDEGTGGGVELADFWVGEGG